MSIFYEVARDFLIKNKISSVLGSTLNQSLATVDILELSNTPRVVYAQGVTNPTGAILAKLKDKMINKCESAIFREAMMAGITPMVKEGLERAVKSTRIDPNILELLGQCLPDVFQQ